MKSKLDQVLRDAKKSFVPKEPNWDAIDAKLLGRIEAARRSEGDARVARVAGASRAWAWASGGLAVAAAVAVFVGKRAAHRSLDVATCDETPCDGVPPAKASALVTHSGNGTILVGDRPASGGEELHAGDFLETRGAVAYLERGAKAITWDVEDQSRIRVTSPQTGTSAALVVALERGALEAQVTPVPSGEAFAVDVAAADGRASRVAVHGTHLRVARVEAAGSVKVVVDLNEGVVSIGVPPRAGSTYGALVTAPAHVELEPQDPAGTLVVSHRPTDVRPAVDLAAAIAAASGASVLPAAPGHGTAPAASALAAAPLYSPTVPKASPAPPPEPPVDPNAPETISRAVKDCMALHAPPADAQLKVSVSTVLELHLTERGLPDLARFDPPLPKGVQDCASAVIYKTRFASGGTTRIRFDF
jgi:hypothetical protein